MGESPTGDGVAVDLYGLVDDRGDVGDPGDVCEPEIAVEVALRALVGGLEVPG